MPEAALLLSRLLIPRPIGELAPLGELSRWAAFAGAFILAICAVAVGSASRLVSRREDNRSLRHIERQAPVAGNRPFHVGHEARPSIEPTTPGTNSVVMFTDVVGFSAAMDRDERATLRDLAVDLDLIRGACHDHGGQVLKTVGDGVLAVFDEAPGAVACARTIQTTLAARPEGRQPSLSHRIGVHAGHIFFLSGDVMGATVNIAARLEKEAPAGGICMSQSVIDACGVLPAGAVFKGERQLRNISGRIPLYELLPDAASCTVIPFPAGKARRLRGEGQSDPRVRLG